MNKDKTATFLMPRFDSYKVFAIVSSADVPDKFKATIDA